MKRESYLRLHAFLDERPRLLRALAGANAAITRAIYLAYPCLIVWLLAHDGAQAALRAVAVPAVGFAAVTLLRRAIDAPRPYEVFGVEASVPKGTRGKSFPSRHAFSIFIIATAFLRCLASPAPAVVVFALGVMLATVRVIIGVHFPRDVIAGALLGTLAGLAGFALA